MVATSFGVGHARAQTALPVPQPFPGAGTPPSTGRPAAPPPAATPPSTPEAQRVPVRAPVTPAPPVAQAPMLPTSVPVYPAAEYLETFDAGSGQQYYLYGTNLSYADIVAYYKTALKTGGRELYKSPGMHQFDLGKFQDDRMAYPPSIVVKDYAGEGSPGYLFVSGTSEKRYNTIIQIVPPGPSR